MHGRRSRLVTARARPLKGGEGGGVVSWSSGLPAESQGQGTVWPGVNGAEGMHGPGAIAQDSETGRDAGRTAGQAWRNTPPIVKQEKLLLHSAPARIFVFRGSP